jgi:HK97 family phage portal protein
MALLKRLRNFANRRYNSPDRDLAYFFDIDGQVKTLRATKSGTVLVDGPGGWMRGESGEGNYSAYTTALAVTVNVWAMRCMTLIANNVARLPRRLYRGEDEITDHPLLDAFDYAWREHKVDPVFLWSASLDIWGVAYFEKARDEHNIPAGFFWLNPEAVQIDAPYGRIRYYVYSDPSTGQMIRYQPHEVIHDRLFHPLSEYDGLSPVEVALSPLRIDHYAKRYVAAYFKNNAKLGVILSPTEGEWTETDEKRILNWFKQDFVGVDKAFRPMFAPKKLQATTIEPPTLEDQTIMLERAAHEICVAFGVPKGLVAQDNTRFQISDSTEVWFYRNTIIPRAENIERIVNSELVPFFDRRSDIRFEIDTEASSPLTQEDQLKAQITQTESATVKQDVDGGLVSIGEAMRRRGYEPPPGSETMFDSLFVYDGVPVPISEVPNLWKYKLTVAPSVYNVEQITGEPLPQPVSPEQVIPTAEGEAQPVDADEIKDDHIPSIRAFAPRHATREDEWRAWRTYALKGSKRPFQPAWLRGDIGDELAAALSEAGGDQAQIKAAFDAVYERVTTKAIQATRLDWEAAFDAVLAELRSGELDRRRAGTILRQMVGSTYGPRAYRDGLIDGGIEDGEFDEDDKLQIAELKAKASSYISELTDTLINGDGISDAQADLKASTWYNRTIHPFYDAGLLSANANAMMEFAGDDGAESCNTCQTLKGQRHRLKDWARKQLRPKTDGDRYDCGAFNCHHFLVQVFAKARGNWI